MSHAWGIALLRVTLGAIYVMHGYLGASVLGPAAVAQYVKRAGLPESFAEPWAWYVIIAHVVGGLMLIAGLWTALAALAQVPIIAGALFLIHLPQGFFMRGIITEAAAGRAIAGGYEFVLLVLAATITLVFTGAGALAVDGRGRYRSRFAKP
ncbi:MAG: DoxX family protein [Candidatus Rokuibacteriota bacterium]